MAKKASKRIIKPKPVKEDKQMDGLNIPFDEAMKHLANPKNNTHPKK